jgi:hypothetical protein
MTTAALADRRFESLRENVPQKLHCTKCFASFNFSSIIF